MELEAARVAIINLLGAAVAKRLHEPVFSQSEPSRKRKGRVRIVWRHRATIEARVG